MADERFERSEDPRCEDAGAWVLGALPEDEAARFAAFLESSDVCAREVAHLQAGADHLPLAVPQVDPLPDLLPRLMAVVNREASLLAAVGEDADRVPAGRESARRGWWGWLVARPVASAAAAAVLVVAGAGIGVFGLSGDGGSSSKTHTQFATGSGRGELITGAQGSELRVSNVASPASGQVYEAWIRHGHGLPKPAGVFTVDRQGRGAVALRGSIDGASEVLVTTEPEGGSTIPTSNALMRVKLA